MSETAHISNAQRDIETVEHIILFRSGHTAPPVAGMLRQFEANYTDGDPDFIQGIKKGVGMTLDREFDASKVTSPIHNVRLHEAGRFLGEVVAEAYRAGLEATAPEVL